jgi:hypothetical protein
MAMAHQERLDSNFELRTLNFETVQRTPDRRATRTLLSVVLVAFALAVAAWPARAQETGVPTDTRRVAVDTVIGTQDYVDDDGTSPAQYVVDAFTTAQIRPHWQVSFRPKVWRTRGDWEGLVDQLSVETDFRRGSNWRIEVGRFPMPIGLGMTENRADLNAGMIWWHRAYYMPLPSLGADVPRVSLVSAVYPEGVQVSTSGAHWDARGALVDRAPVQFWHAAPGSTRGPNGVAGGGVTPWQGFRLGAGVAWGQFADATDARGGLDYRMASVEGEYAFGYTKISGEWTHDRFETVAGDRISKGWTLQAQQTLTPRIFVHVRASGITSPEVSRSVPATTIDRAYRSIDTTIGYRLTPQFTLRLGHTAMRGFTSQDYDQQVGFSFMWTRRWW